MGGPSRESYRAAEAARKKRIAATRTRNGVVDLGELRVALRGARVLEGLLHEPPWLLGVRVVVAKEVGFEIVVTIVRDELRFRMCLPASIDDVPVRMVARNPGRERAGASATVPPAQP